MVHRRTYLALLAGGATGVLSGAGRGEARSPPITEATRTAQPEDPTQQAKLSGDLDNHDEFGWAVALDGTTAIVGAPEDEGANGWPAGGSAHVFERTDGTWTWQTKLGPRYRQAFLGGAVALDGSTALVGATVEHPLDAPGRVDVFEQVDGTWEEQTTLSTGDDGFGEAVALDGSTALVGATDNDPHTDTAGAAYVFERSGGTWEQQAKLTAADGDSDDFFGGSVTLDEPTALIGAKYDEDPNGSEAGAAYVFERSGGTWEQQAKLTAADGDSEDFFGWAVALDGATALIGANYDEDPNGESAGAAYVFERSDETWEQQAKLTAADGDSEDFFGWAVALDGSTAVVGAVDDDNSNGERAGAAYVFEPTDGSWTQKATLTAADGDSGDRFGSAVALDGSSVLVGAANDEEPSGEGGGSAYVFTLGADGSDPSAPPDVTGDGNRSQDPDDDGLYEDVTGDGDTTPGDATVLFDSVFEGDSAVMEHVSLFDFNGDGALTPGDATVLFDEIF